MLAAPHGLRDRDLRVLLLERRQHLLQEVPAFEGKIGVVKQGVRVQSGCMPRCTPQGHCKSRVAQSCACISDVCDRHLKACISIMQL